jgi:hypothetical protein
LTSLGSQSDLTSAFSVFLIFIGIVCFRIMSGRRIRRWAAWRQLTLVDWRTAWLEDSLGMPLQSRHREAFYIEVEDSEGLPATGWLKFRSWFSGDDADVEWT